MCISGLLHGYIYSNLIELVWHIMPTFLFRFQHSAMNWINVSEAVLWIIYMGYFLFIVVPLGILFFHYISLLSWFYAAIFFIIHVFLLWFVSCLAYHFLDIFAPRVIPLFLHCEEGSVDQISFYLLTKELKFVMIYIYM